MRQYVPGLAPGPDFAALDDDISVLAVRNRVYVVVAVGMPRRELTTVPWQKNEMFKIRRCLVI